MKSTFLKRAREFLLVNIWVQKIRLESLGSWYYFDIFYEIFSKLGGFATTFAYGLIVNDAIRYLTTSNKSLTSIYYLLIGLFIYKVTEQILEYYYYSNQFWKGQYQMRKNFHYLTFLKLGSLNWEHIETSKMEKDIQMSFTYSVVSIEDLASVHISLVTISIAIVSALMVAKISPWILLIIFVKELPGIYRRFIKSKLEYKTTSEIAPLTVVSQGVMNYFRDFKTLMEMKVSNVYKRFANLLAGNMETFAQKRVDITSKFLPSTVGVKVLEQAFDIGVYAYYLREVLFKGMQIGTFQYTTKTIIDISDYMYEILEKMSSMVDSYRYVRHAYDLIHQENIRPDGTKMFKGEKIEIEFDDVSFKYPGNEKFALQNISLKIKDNESVAIVGENGAGKTTFLKLLTLVIAPTSGTILINGVPVQEYTKESIYKVLAIVSQDFARYDVLSVGQNISVYENSSKSDTNRLEAAAKMATADKFIEKLSKKYDTLLTKKLDGGTELSTGQWQRLAIARQFYANRPLIVLDEPTAAIDPIAEATIFRNLYEHVKDKTVIVVSHRYNTVRAAKKILVFKEGQIVEQGNHEELLEIDGYYANAFKVQQEVKAL